MDAASDHLGAKCDDRLHVRCDDLHPIHPGAKREISVRRAAPITASIMEPTMDIIEREARKD